ncbi:SRPBCC family protein [Actinoplanes sp. NPDC049599]|uniref:SRPBCC family protein n=1 Tax=Actinoplanes sp. NPDC049599 TaxID=3363903 RepID=UPI0037B828D9
MATFDLSVSIRRPPAAVFAVLADIQDSEPIPRNATVRMVKEPLGPTAVGTRWHEWVAVAPHCRLYVESVVSEVNEPYRLGMDFRSRWFTGHLTYDIEAAADGSVLHHRETVRPRLFARWLSPVLARGMRPRLVRRLADLKMILEE